MNSKLHKNLSIKKSMNDESELINLVSPTITFKVKILTLNADSHSHQVFSQHKSKFQN